MKLGYLRVLPLSHTGQAGGRLPFSDRADLTRALGVSAFSSTLPRAQCPLLALGPEQAAVSRVAPTPDGAPTVHLVCRDGVCGRPHPRLPDTHRVAPAAQASQMRHNSAQAQAPLSASWLPAEQVAAGLHSLSAATGPFAAPCVVNHAWADVTLARQSLALLAGVVLPLFQVQQHRNTRELEFA